MRPDRHDKLATQYLANRRRWLRHFATSALALAAFALLAASCGPEDTSGGDTSAVGDEATTQDAAETSQPEPTPEPESGPTPEPEPTDEPEPQPTPEPEPQGIQWEDCGDGLECTLFDVPLEYDDPDGEVFTLNITRSPARSASDRIGPVFVNAGGPGAGARDLIVQYATSPLNDFFDIVGIDPRGTGDSQPIACNDNFEEDLAAPIDTTDGWEDELEAFAYDFVALGEACRTQYGNEFLLSVRTENVARDMEAVRLALGGEQLNYIGVSYGTTLGSVYATLFPDNIRTLVLDSAISPTNVNGGIERMIDYRNQYQRLDASCANDPACPLHEIGFLNGIADLSAELEQGPVDGATTIHLRALLGFLAGNPGDLFGITASAVDEALDGDGETLVFVGDLVLDGFDELLGGANQAVTCADGGRLSSARLREILPLLERSTAEVPEQTPIIPYPCNLWPVEGIAVIQVDYTGDAPILVINNSGDALTPVRFAQELVDDIGPKATLVVNDRDGHGAFNTGVCITGLTMRYFLELEVPQAGTVCPAEGNFGFDLGPDGTIQIDPNIPPGVLEVADGDRVLTVNGTPIEELAAPPTPVVGETIIIEVDRGGETLQIDVSPTYMMAELWRLGG